MHYIQANIGRNFDLGTGTLEMTDDGWHNFQQDVISLLRVNAMNHQTNMTTFEIHYGVGTWEGVTEESAHISALSSDGWDTENIKLGLAWLAEEYKQDSIAFIEGSSLITVNP